MSKKKLSNGTVHKLPKDLRKALAAASDDVCAAWEDITPLARNEFICWVISPKKPETRERRIRRAIEELADGERRPCCWSGCIHRPDKEMSPSQKHIHNKKSGSDE